MSDLVKALKFVDKWVYQNIPNHPAVMNQGLSREVIELRVKDLPFRLPTEVYDLYQWRNGGVKPFIPYPEGWDLAGFLPLEESIEAALAWNSNFNLFPLFTIEDAGYFIVCTQEKYDQLPIYCSDVPEQAMDSQPQYSSLTDMMQELVKELKSRNKLTNL
jgi:hypothetical protein